ncbi:MAG: sigma-70 family RNA polymerase sigma factor [Nitrospirae bacterium]|nr:sigma-70 family RNA polymerase sigma factor [Nitrospirota bacterium]
MSGQDFQDIYNSFHEKIRRYLGRMVCESEAEDLAHDVFMKVNAGLKDFRGESSLPAWIYRIATNTALDRLRSPDLRRADRTRASIDEHEMDIEDTNVWSGVIKQLPDQQLIRKEMNTCIRGFIGGLPEDYRVVLVLSEFEGFTNAEIAGAVGISLDTVKIRLHRARIRLRKELAANCNFSRDERNELACDRRPASLKILNT